MKVIAPNPEVFEFTFSVGETVTISEEIPGVRGPWQPPGLPGAVYRVPRNVLGLLPESDRELARQAAWPPPQTVPVSPRRELYPHQHVAVTRALGGGRLLLADQLGLGKTTSAATAAAAHQKATGRPVLILGPQYLRSVWRSELEALGLLEDAPFWAAQGAGPTPASLKGYEGAKWLFCHYDIIGGWWNLLSFARLCAVIYDEAHLLKNPDSKRSKAAALVTPGNALRLVLTGTPIQNGLKEAHTLLSLTTGPGTWGSRFDFRKRYAGLEHNGYGWIDTHPTNVEELQTRLDDVYLRRDVEVLNKPLPERTRRRLDVTLDPEDLELLREELRGYTPKQIFDALRRAQGGKDTISWISALRKITSSAKFSTTLEHCKGLVEQGDSAVVFVWQRATAKRLARAVGGHYVAGDMPQTERDAVVEAWKAEPGAAALVATYDTLSTGVTLTKANHVVFHDLDYVPAKMLQAEGRVYRIGQNRPVQSWWIVAENTLDPFFFNIVQRKAPATAVFGEMGTGNLGDFLGDSMMDQEVEDLIAWSLRQEG